jgi:hypothetical protein
VPRVLAITIARKPLSEGSVAKNVLRWGTGSLNVGASRVGSKTRTYKGFGASPLKLINHGPGDTGIGMMDGSGRDQDFTATGRWPANLILQHKDGCRQVGIRQVGTGEYTKGEGSRPSGFGNVGADKGDHRPCGPTYGTEDTPVWKCALGCPVADLDAQSGVQVSGVAVQRHGGGQNIFGGVRTSKGPGTVREDEGYGDTGGASRYFKQVGRSWEP